MSVFIPGLGQLYLGRAFSVLWFVFVVIGYVMLFVPGVILHICCVVAALAESPATTVVAQQAAASRPIVPTSRLPPSEDKVARKLGRGMASLAHPLATMRSNNAGAKILVIFVYAIGLVYAASLVAFSSHHWTATLSV